MKKQTILVLMLMICIVILSAEVPNLIDFQGRLANANGYAIDGNVSITFTIYDSETNRTALWTETQSVDVTDGLFQVTLGESTTFPNDLFDSLNRWIGINVAGDGEMTPRTKLASVPYALQGGTAAPDDDWTIDGDNVYHENGNVGIGTTNPDTDLTVYSDEDYHGLTLQSSNNLFNQGFRFRNPGGHYAWNMYRKDDGTGSSDLVFASGHHGNVADLTDRIIFKRNGNVGIGTTSPTTKLDVNGAVTATLFSGGGDEGIFVDGNGDVGIGTTSPDTDTKLHVTGSDLYAGYFTSDYQNNNNHVIHSEYTGEPSDAIAVYGKSALADYYGYGGYFKGGWTGVWGEVDPTGNVSYFGVIGHVLGGDGTNYGVHGEAVGGSTNYAGYFNGNLHYTGTLSGPSDNCFTENIQPLGQALSKLMQMKVHTYKFIEQEKEKQFNLPEGKQMGLIAQELEEIYPELVMDEVHSYDLNKDKEGVEKNVHKLEYKGINYIGLIPVLTKAIQEQQEIIEELNKRIEKLENK